MNRPQIPVSYLTALVGAALTPSRPVKKYKIHDHSQEQKQVLKDKKSKRKAAKQSRKRNR